VAIAVAAVVDAAVVDAAATRGVVTTFLVSLAQAESTITAPSVIAPALTFGLRVHLCTNQTVHPVANLSTPF